MRNCWTDLELPRSDNLARPNALECLDTGGKVKHDVRQAIRLHAKNQNSNLPARYVFAEI